MVVRQKRSTLAILLTLSGVVFITVTLINVGVENVPKPKTVVGTGNAKEIVAYSLLKRIEIESEQYTCTDTHQLKPREINYNYGFNESGNDDDDESTWTRIDGSDLYVYSVHLDGRLDPYHYVRIIGMIKGTFHQLVYCRFSTPTKEIHVKITTTPIWVDVWDKNDTNIYFNPVLLSCRVPHGLVPNSVVVTTKLCDNQGTFFRFNNAISNGKHQFTVCVKPMDFSVDISIRLIQWIEIMRILGAERIEFYVKNVTKEVRKVLEWYETAYPSQMLVRNFKVIPSETTPGVNNFSRMLWQKRRYELIAYNDCFYRNIRSSQFIIPLDVDEIIIPKKVLTWKSLFEDIPYDVSASFMVSNAYFFGNLPRSVGDKVFFLRNTLRSDFSPHGESGKSFISTRNSLTVFNHYALDVLRPGVSRTVFLPSGKVQMNHYKEYCNAVILPECFKYVSSPRIKDVLIFKYKTMFMDRYLSILHVLRMQNLSLGLDL